MTPTPDVRAELVAFLEEDTSRTGDVHRLLEEGLTDQQIAERLQVATPNFVWNQRVILRALLDGEIPQSPSVVAQVSRKVRTVLRSDGLSPTTTAYLHGLLAGMPVAATQPTDDATQNMREGHARIRLALELLTDEPDGLDLDELYELVTAVYPRATDSDPTKSRKTGRMSFSYDLGQVVYAGWANLSNNHLWLTAAGRQALEECPDADTLWTLAVTTADRPRLEGPHAEPTAEDLATRIVPLMDDPLVRRAARQTIDLGFGEGRSMLDPDMAAWSRETAEDLHNRYNLNVDESSRAFLDKLHDQLKDAPDATILLAADLIDLLQLPLVNVGQKVKAGRIRRILTWLDEARAPGPLLSYAWFQGAWHGGVGSNTMLWRGLFDLVNFLREWWDLPEDERAGALSDPWVWSQVVASDTLTMPSTSHALRYLAFPEYFLPIVNSDHKISIRDAFLPEIGSTTGDIERDLFAITLALQQQRQAAVDFYEPDLRQRWDAHVVVTGRAWLIRGSSVQGKNLVPTWLSEGFVSLPAIMLDPVPEGADRETIASAVQAVFANRAPDYQRQKVEEYDAFLRVMAPGDLVITTADGMVHVGEITGASRWDTETTLPGRLQRPVTWQTPGVDYADLPDPLPARLTANENVTDLTEDRAVIESLIGEQAPPAKPGLSAPTQELADSVHLPLEWLQRVTRLMQRRKAIILFGPPGTGKTYVAQALTNHWTDPGNTDLVQFHPSVAYEDFIAGYRPVDRDGQVVFELRQGPFMRLAELARDNPGVPHVLIIDEINRANLAKVFGELYFLLEYRDRAMTPLYSDDTNRKFTLPENVYLIGTMNTADRSIALVDAAMRRRFAFVSMHADEEPVNGVLRSWLAENGLDPQPADLLDQLNRRITDRDFRIGPSYLMDEAMLAEPDGLDEVWATDLLPLLEEHHAGQNIDVEALYGLAALRRALAEE